MSVSRRLDQSHSEDLGVVRLTPEDIRVRAVLVDDVLVLTDAWDIIGPGWPLTREGSGHYFPYKIDEWRQMPLYQNEKLTPEEVTLHRPDLPLTILRRTGWNWTRGLLDFGGFVKAVRAQGLDMSEDESVLDTAAVALIAIGHSGDRKKPVIVQPRDGGAWTMMGLMFAANCVIEQGLGSRQKVGTGLYRFGLHEGLPSFYIWGDRDLAKWYA